VSEEIISFSKLKLLVFRRLKFIVKRNHVVAILYLLVEEMIEELFSGNDIEIGNFATIKLKRNPAGTIINGLTKIEEEYKASTTIRFELKKKLRDKLANNLDIKKVFGKKDGYTPKG
jgi:nucleoid DNA-binding protein